MSQRITSTNRDETVPKSEMWKNVDLGPSSFLFLADDVRLNLNSFLVSFNKFPLRRVRVRVRHLSFQALQVPSSGYTVRDREVQMQGSSADIHPGQSHSPDISSASPDISS